LAGLEAPLDAKLLKENNISDEWWEFFIDAPVAINTSFDHVTSDGSSHSDVVLNNTHRVSDGTDHTFINQSVTTAANPTFAGLTVTGDLTVDGKDMIKWAVLQG